jgi:NNP family nitrate/nitrite transporter-like MFS transporter
VVTGLVGMTGGIGGFYLASSLGLARKLTGTYQTGFLAFAALVLLALIALQGLKHHWRAVWPTLQGGDPVPVRL